MVRLERIIFSIDKVHDVHHLAKFLRWIDNQRAMNNLKSDPIMLIGKWQDHYELSFMTTAFDYDKYVKPWGYVDGQLCVLRVPGDTRQPCVLEYFDGKTEVVGPMVQVVDDRGESWSYRVDNRTYWRAG